MEGRPSGAPWLRGDNAYFHLRALTICLHDVNRSDKTIPTPWQRLDEPWVLGVIPQRLTQFIHGGVNAVFKINEGIGGPELLLDLFPRHNFPGPLEEHGENLEGSFLQLDLVAIMAEFTPSKVNFELPDPYAHRSRGG